MVIQSKNALDFSVFVGASASTMLSSAEFVCLRVAIARSSGRNCALAAPGGSRKQYGFGCKGRDRGCLGGFHLLAHWGGGELAKLHEKSFPHYPTPL